MKSIARLVVCGLFLGVTMAGTHEKPASAAAVVIRQSGAAIDCYTADGDIRGCPGSKSSMADLRLPYCRRAVWRLAAQDEFRADLVPERTYTAAVQCADDWGCTRAVSWQPGPGGLPSLATTLSPRS